MTKILLIFSSFLPAARVLAVDATVPDLTAVPQATGDAGTKLGGWIQGFYQFSLIAGVFLAVGVIVWAGLRYALAAGNPSTQSDARDQILQALLGLILLMGAYLVLTTVNPNLTNLVPPTINRVGELGNAPAAQNVLPATDGFQCTASNGTVTLFNTLAQCNFRCTAAGGTCSQYAGQGGTYGGAGASGSWGNTTNNPGGDNGAASHNQ